MSVLVDTSIWASFLRTDALPDDPHVTEFRRLKKNDSIRLIGPIRQEILSGASPHSKYVQLRETLEAFPDIPLETLDYEVAAEFYNICRNRGEQNTSVDLLLCAVSANHHIAIYTLDTNLKRLSKLLPIQLHQIS